MENQKFQDDMIVDILKKTARKLHSNSFDDKVMSKINYDLKLKSQVSKQLKRSLFFFVAGTILGIGATVFFMMSSSAILGINTRDFGLILLFIICVVGIMSFDNIRRLINTYTPQI